MWKKLLPLLLLSVVFAARGQEEIREDYFISAKAKGGFLLAHHDAMTHLPKQHIVGGEISVYKRFSRAKSWHTLYSSPYAGVTLYGANNGNNAILGYSFGMYGFLEFPFISSRRHTLSFKVANGLGYVTKTYDPITNPKDNVLSSHVNALICLGFSGRIRLAERHELLYSIDMTHLSDGSFKVPNLGLNLPYIGIGYAYNVASRTRPVIDTVNREAVPGWVKGWYTTVMGIFSLKEIYPTGGKKYPVYAISISERKIFRPKSGIEFTLDVISKQSIIDYRPYIHKTQWDILQIGGFVGYVLPLDRFQFVIGMGAYVKDRYRPDQPVYNRLGMRYYFKNGLIANVTLKTHFAVADYIECGIGYAFRNKKK